MPRLQTSHLFIKVKILKIILISQSLSRAIVPWWLETVKWILLYSDKLELTVTNLEALIALGTVYQFSLLALSLYSRVFSIPFSFNTLLFSLPFSFSSFPFQVLEWLVRLYPKGYYSSQGHLRRFKVEEIPCLRQPAVTDCAISIEYYSELVNQV